MASTARCEEHGLAYDPEVSSGCVLCRRSTRPAPATGGGAMPWLMVVVMVGVLGLGVIGLLIMRQAHRPAEAITTPPAEAPQDAPPEPAAEPKGAEQHALPAERGALQTKNGSGRSGAYFAPARDHGDRLPVLVAMHGTGGAGADMVKAFEADAIARRFVIVAPDSRRSPQGQWTWQVADAPGEVTPDLTHTMACLGEVRELLGGRLDDTRVLLAGHSGGASSAPYIATNRPPFSAFAVLHGGVFAGGLGERAVRGWFSTGSADGMRTPAMVREAAEQARGRGLTDITYREFPGGHRISDAERAALLDWWLGS